MRPRVSVVVLNYNGKRFLRECLTSILAQRTPWSFEVLFVDNASADGSLAYVRESFSAPIEDGRLRLVALEKNTGFTGGNNTGVKLAKGEICVLVNNDVRVQAGWLTELVKPLEDRHIAIAGCNNLSPQGSTQDFTRYYGKLRICEAMNLYGADGTRKMTRSEMEQNLVHPFFIGGVCLAFRKRDVPVPFDNDYFAYSEDVALCWRMRLEGKEVVINPKARMWHYGGSVKRSSRSISSITVFHGTKNSVMNFLIFYEWKNIIRILPLFMIYQAFILMRQLPLTWTRVRAYAWVVSHFPSIMRKRAVMQRRRRVPDRELLRFMSYKPFDTLNTTQRTSGVRKVIKATVNGVVWCYVKIVGLRTADS